jgi:hypothetical protein
VAAIGDFRHHLLSARLPGDPGTLKTLAIFRDRQDQVFSFGFRRALSLRSDVTDELMPHHYGADPVEDLDVGRQLAPIDLYDKLPLVLADTDAGYPGPSS